MWTFRRREFLGLERVEKAYPGTAIQMDKSPMALCLFSTVLPRYKESLYPRDEPKF